MARPTGQPQPPALVLDAHPLVVWINGEPGAADVKGLLRDAEAGRLRLLVSVVNAAEVMLVQERRGGAEASHRTLDLLQELPLELVDVDLPLAARAAYLKTRGGISLADCFAAALAHREGVPVLTGDPEFDRVADLVTVRRLRTAAMVDDRRPVSRSLGVGSSETTDTAQRTGETRPEPRS